MNNGYEHASQYQLFLCAYLHGKRVMPLACERVKTCRVRAFTLFPEIPWRVTNLQWTKERTSSWTFESCKYMRTPAQILVSVLLALIRFVGTSRSIHWTGVILKRRPKNEDLRPHGLKRRPLGLKRRPHGLKRLMLTAEGNARSRNLLRRFGNVVEFPLQYLVVIVKSITYLSFRFLCGKYFACFKPLWKCLRWRWRQFYLN